MSVNPLTIHGTPVSLRSRPLGISLGPADTDGILRVYVLYHAGLAHPDMEGVP